MITIHCAGDRLPVASLVPYARNSRTHSAEQIEQLASAMREWGFTSPVIVDSAGGIVAGHGRVMAAQALGMLEVPVIVAHGWSEAQKRAYVIADNRLALNAGWDEVLLAREMADLREMGFSLDLIGFDERELLGLFTVEGKPGAVADEAMPSAPSRPVSIAGDVWNCGAHRVMCGDGAKPAAVATVLAGVPVDLLIVAPPSRIEDPAPGALRAFLAAAFGVALDPMRAGASFYVWHPDREGFAYRGALSDVGMRIRQSLIWEKTAMVMDGCDYRAQHLPCLYGWKDGAAHLWASNRSQTTILEFAEAPGADASGGLPVALAEYLICNSTRGQGVVLDTFAGTGATLIAAEKNDRRARLVEIDPARVDVAVLRWEAFSGRDAVLASSGETWAAVQAFRSSAAADSPLSGGTA